MQTIVTDRFWPGRKFEVKPGSSPSA